MRPISLHVEDEVYSDLKSVAESTGRPVAELIREAMAEYLARQVGQGGSIFDLPPHESGALLQAWTRDELFDEMLDS